MGDNQHKQIVRKCMEILLEIDRVCKANHLTYYVYAGTLLGAVRHKGLIPWDDDIDIVMPRADYERFEAVFPQQCGEQFALQSIRTDPYTNNPWIKVHDTTTSFISGLRRKGCMEGINIDVFPIDNVPDNAFVRKLRAKIIDKINYMYQWRFAAMRNDYSLKWRVFRAVIALVPPFNEQKFKEKYDTYIQKYNNRQTKDVVYFSNRKYLRKVIDRHVFDTTVYLPFENIQVPAPAGWEAVLEGLYGKNYMELPPESERVTVHGTTVIDLENGWELHEEAYAYETV